ncbi:glycosyltransferase [Sedimentitalea sp. JM2-8]|uniref:Glycosyltransferase n=1 Tax=Sedimentitalea xiamensis TaxID=3050037 RepID=A0ABT7FAC9_9RHOB|nr:glycosyltransferase [Sedimentitalea xiamensis]MDK3072064.1 glycosyltransferase [Sedimentitalea xiamensis]
MKITHICEADSGGGAMLAAAKLHKAMQKLGIDSKVLVRIKMGNDPSFLNIRENLDPLDWIDYKLRRFRNKRLKRKYRPRPMEQVGPFSTGMGSLGNALSRNLPESDIFALHWSSDLIDLLPLMKTIGKRPAFWRMADMNLMTGGCHYSMGCDHFQQACGDCPVLQNPAPDDLSQYALERKSKAFADTDPKHFHPVAPSRWLKKQADRSSLLKRFDTIHIPTGVNTDDYRPIPRSNARQRLGLENSEKILLFAAEDVNDLRKGFDLLLDSLRRLPKSLHVTPVAMGKAHSRLEGIRYLGKLDGAEALAVAYSAADAFVLPTRADNLPNVALEAMACGLPVLSFDVGGMPDCVFDGETGFLAPPEDTLMLAKNIETVLTNEALRKEMGEKCRTLMLNQFNENLSVQRYVALCEKMIEEAGR